MASWSSDSRWLGFTSNRVGDKNQIFAIPPKGGEAVQFTKVETGVNSFEWSPDGKSIAFTAAPSKKEVTKNRKEHLGDFEVVRKEYDHQHLWTIDVGEAFKTPQTGKEHTKGKKFSVGGFTWSPDSSKIAFDASINPDLIQRGTADIHVLNLGDGAVKKILAQPGPDTGPQWSPDGKQIAFRSAMGKPDFFHRNSRIAVVPADGGNPRSVTDAFDESPLMIDWKPDGIYFFGFQKTASHLFRVDSETAEITLHHCARTAFDGGRFFAHARRPRNGLYGPIADVAERGLLHRRFELRASQADRHDRANQGLHAGSLRSHLMDESQDGMKIEGVLTKPANFDPSKKRPSCASFTAGQPASIDPS